MTRTQAVDPSISRMPIPLDAKLRDGHAWLPNGFGMIYPTEGTGGAGPPKLVGVNMNAFTDTADRDPLLAVLTLVLFPVRLSG